MKTSSILRAFAAFTILAGAVSAGNQDYQCQNAPGCVATIYQDGATRRILFRKGDLITLAAGWVIDPKDGWVKIPTGGGDSESPPPKD